MSDHPTDIFSGHDDVDAWVRENLRGPVEHGEPITYALDELLESHAIWREHCQRQDTRIAAVLALADRYEKEHDWPGPAIDIRRALDA